MELNDVNALGKAALRLKTERVPLYEVSNFEGATVACLRAGMEQVVHALLTSAGIAVESLSILVPVPMPMSDPQPLPLGLPNDIELIRILASRDLLLCRIDRSRFEVAALIAQIAVRCPDLRIVVATIRKSEVKLLDARLKGWEINPTPRRDLMGLGEPPPRLVIETIACLHLDCVDLRGVDLLVFPDAIESLGTVASRLIGQARGARVLGFLDQHQFVSDPDAIGLLERFGPGGPTILYHGSMVRPTIVDFVTFKNRLPLAKDAALVDIKRAGIWEHRERNQFVVSLCKSLSKSGDDLSVSLRFQSVRKLLGDRDVGPVVVLVETAEHADALRHRLSGWELRCAANGEPGKIASSCIATAADLRGSDLSAVNVVLRADGGTGLPPGLTLQSRSTIGEPHPLIILDIHDRHHPALRQHAGKRRQAYLDAGWPVGTDVDAMPELARFLAPRHRRMK